MEEDITIIKTCSFSNLKASIGGAISISTSIEIILESTNFFSCYSYGSTTSSCGSSGIGGGSCYFDVKRINATYIYTSHCESEHSGDSIYICAPNSEYSDINCLSDSFSGKEKTGFSTIYFVDKCQSYINNINFTYPKFNGLQGTIHIGSYPIFSHMLFINAIFNSICDNYATFGFSCEASHTYNSKYCNIVNFNAKEGYSILSLYRGNYEISHYYLYNCSGDLAKAYYSFEIFNSAIFSQCYFSSGINTQLSSLQIESTLESYPTNFITEVCIINTNKRCITQNKGTKTKLITQTLIFTIIHMKTIK